MSKRINNLKAEERRLERLAQAKSNVRTRLADMRVDVVQLVGVLDRLTCQPPRMHAGTGPLSGLNLLPFPRSRR